MVLIRSHVHTLQPQIRAEQQPRDTGRVSSVNVEPPLGPLLRQWRKRRQLSQLDLALAAEISARHLSFVETGRAIPSRTMVLRLATALELPRRETNQLLIAAGLAPEFAGRSLDDPAMATIRHGVEQVLAAYAPYPCLAVDRGWNIVAANTGAAVLLDGVAPQLLTWPNALRIALHPDGMAPRIQNLGQWRHHLVGRLQREVAVSAAADLVDLLTEIESFPGEFDYSDDADEVMVPLRLTTAAGVTLSFLSTVTTFGTALDLTAAELSIEAFLPADEATAAALR
jgi:transcriptional regulator with XRE-family HTH domain